MTQQEMHAEIAAAYVQDGEDAAFLSPEIIALIMQLIQGLLGGCTPAGAMLAIRFPRIFRMDSRIENYVAASRNAFEQNFDEPRVVAAIKKLTQKASLSKIQAVKGS